MKNSLKMRIGIIFLSIGLGISLSNTVMQLNELEHQKHLEDWANDKSVFPDMKWFDPSWNNELPEYWRIGDKYYKIRDLMGRHI